MRKGNVWLLALAAGIVLTVSADGFEAKRKAMLERSRTILWDDDGCDMGFYPINQPEKAGRPVSVRDFEQGFLSATEGTRTDAICYSPVFGFGYFLTTRAGYLNTNRQSAASAPTRNAAREFNEAFGKDCLDLATDFARRTGREIILSMRFNDTHDVDSTWDRPNRCFSPFKLRNPDCLMGSRPGLRPPHGSWTAADFSQEKTREFCRQYMRAFFENYDLDGVLYDFFRHLQLFSSVAWGGHASHEELQTMTDLMKDLRRIAEEAGRRRGRPFLVGVRVPDSLGYGRAIGIDLESWLREKSLDFVVFGGEMQMEEWESSAALAHRHGVKAYASISEPRFWLKELLPNRQSRDCWLARAAAAMAQGMDGVYYFNLEYRPAEDQRYVLGIDPRDADGYDKLYFSVYLGGTWHSRCHLADADAFNRLSGISPERSFWLAAGDAHDFELAIADDFAKWRARGKEPVAAATLLTNATDGGAVSRLVVNGTALKPSAFRNGAFDFAVPVGALHRGRNRLSVRAASSVRVADFCLSIKARAD